MAVKSGEQIMAERMMAEAKAKKAAQPNVPVPPMPSSSGSSSASSGSSNTKVGSDGQTYYKYGDTWARNVDPTKANQAQITQMTGQLAKNGTISDQYKNMFGMSTSVPTPNYYKPPSGMDSNKYVLSGGLAQDAGKTSMNSYKTSDGRFMDTTGMTAQQIHASRLWDTNPNEAMKILSGMGLDRYGNQALPNGQGYNIPMPSNTGVTPNSNSGIPNRGMGTSNPLLKNSDGARVSASSLGTDFRIKSVPTPPMYGGFTYGTDSTKDKSLESNMRLWESDPAAKAAEIERTKGVIRGMESRGEDATAQKKHLYGTLGYQDTKKDTTVEQPTPNPPPEQDYEKLARAEFAEQLAAKESWAAAQKASLQQGWDRSNQLTNDQRVLENWQFEDKNSPFAGRTSYLKTNLGRERTLADASSRDQFNANIAGIESELSNFRGTVEQQIAARANQLQQQAIEQAMREAELTGSYNGTQTLAAQNQTFNQNLAAEELNQKVAQQQWENTFAEKQFTEESARNLWERTFKEKTFDQEVKAAAKRLNLDWAQLSQRQKEFVAEEAYKAKSLALDERKLELDANKPADYSKDISSIESMYVAKDPYTGQMKITNASAMKNAIIALNMPDEMTDRYLIMYGLPINQ